jgi:hypothetical protein
MSLFSAAKTASMRDRTKRRNYSASAEEFSREHSVRRSWGLQQRHARKMSRLHGSVAAAWTAYRDRVDELQSEAPAASAGKARLPASAGPGSVPEAVKALPDPAVPGPVVPGPVVAGPVVPGPVVAGPVVAGPVVAGPAVPESVVSEPVRAERGGLSGLARWMVAVSAQVGYAPLASGVHRVAGSDLVTPDLVLADLVLAEPVLAEPVVAEPVRSVVAASEQILSEAGLAEPIPAAVDLSTLSEVSADCEQGASEPIVAGSRPAWRAAAALSGVSHSSPQPRRAGDQAEHRRRCFGRWICCASPGRLAPAVRTGRRRSNRRSRAAPAAWTARSLPGPQTVAVGDGRRRRDRGRGRGRRVPRSPPRGRGRQGWHRPVGRTAFSLARKRRGGAEG